MIDNGPAKPNENMNQSKNKKENKKQIPIDVSSLEKQTETIIQGISVHFPYPPYKVQVEYMSTLIKTLQNGENCALESPTGTGKTLSLLCSSLAFLWESWLSGKSNTKIIFFSRTHSQLSQVVEQLKKTIYRPAMMVVGGRDYTCANKDVLSLQGPLLKIKCLELTRDKKCSALQNYENQIDFDFPKQIFDIEELRQEGIKQTFCTFHFSKRFENCDITFMPYNYVFDPQYQKSHKGFIKNSILIFDEAHNVESVAEEESSVSFLTQDLLSFIQIYNTMNKKIQNDMHEEFAACLQTLYGNVIQSLSDNYQKNQIQKSGHFFELLENLSLTSTHKEYFQNINKKNIFLIPELIKELSFHMKEQSKVSQADLTVVENMFAFFDFIVPIWQSYHQREKSLEKQDYEFFCLHIESQGGNLRFDLWCNDASFMFKQIQQENPMSIVFTSGTLSPIEIFSKEIGVHFENKYSGSHVIQVQKQIFCKTVVKIKNTPINLSFKTRENPDQMREIGYFIVDALWIVPEGALVFFGSYQLLNQFYEFWKVTEILKQIQQQKDIYREYSGYPQTFKNTINKFRANHHKGAVFFAVCGGKLSEGIDFSDSMARAVFVIGIPFPNFSSLRVQAKMRYLDQKLQQNQNGLSSNNWFKTKGLRQTNQAVGRVIRHRLDFGSVFLLDDRFSQNENSQMLSAFVRQSVLLNLSPGEIFQQLKAFYQGALEFIEDQKLLQVLITQESKAQKDQQDDQQSKQSLISLQTASWSLKDIPKCSKNLENLQNDDLSKVKSNIILKKKNVQIKCVVCYLDQTELFTGWCGHIICFKCVTIVLDQTKECPMCRQPIEGQKSLIRLHPSF